MVAPVEFVVSTSDEPSPPLRGSRLWNPLSRERWSLWRCPHRPRRGRRRGGPRTRSWAGTRPWRLPNASCKSAAEERWPNLYGGREESVGVWRGVVKRLIALVSQVKLHEWAGAGSCSSSTCLYLHGVSAGRGRRVAPRRGKGFVGASAKTFIFISCFIHSKLDGLVLVRAGGQLLGLPCIVHDLALPLDRRASAKITGPHRRASCTRSRRATRRAEPFHLVHVFVVRAVQLNDRDRAGQLDPKVGEVVRSLRRAKRSGRS